MPILHTTFVKETNPGGRLYSGVDQAEVRKNGEFGFLGARVAGNKEIKTFEKKGVGHLASQFPVVIMQPEMMYDNSRKSLLKLKNFDIKAGTPFVCIPLQESDKFDITDDALNLRGQNANDVLVVGKCYELVNDSTLLTLTTNNNGDAPAAAGSVYFEIVKVKDAHTRSARNNRNFMNDNYKLYTLEVKVKR